MGRARRRHTPEQIIRKLREADRLLGEGQEVAVVAKQLEVSEQTLHRWRLQYGGLKADDAKRLKELVRPLVTLHPKGGHGLGGEFELGRLRGAALAPSCCLDSAS